MVSPEPTPLTPSSVSTVTSVASKCRRGWGSHAAANGGSSGSRSRSTLIDVIFTVCDRTTELDTGASDLALFANDEFSGPAAGPGDPGCARVRRQPPAGRSGCGRGREPVGAAEQ